MKNEYKMEMVIKEGKIPATIIHQQLDESKMFVPPHWHKDIELNLLLLNKGVFVVDGIKQEIEAGDMILINSSVIHSGYAEKDVKRQELVTILWDYDFFKRNCENFEQYRINIDKIPGTREKIKKMMLEIALLYERQEKYGAMKILSLLYSLGALLLEDCLMSAEEVFGIENQQKIVVIQKAIKYIEEHYPEDITLEMVAEKIHLSPVYFSKKFRLTTGICFHDCLVECRLKHARDELIHTNNTITEIALNNGFKNVKSFIEYFKKYYHTTPKQYQKKHDEKKKEKFLEY